MRLLTIVAVAAVANPGGVDVGVSGGTVRLRGRLRKEERDFALDEQPGELGPMQSGIASGV